MAQQAIWKNEACNKVWQPQVPLHMLGAKMPAPTNDAVINFSSTLSCILQVSSP